MKRKTRNNILRYVVALVAVLVFLLIVLLIGEGMEWLSNKTELPIYTVVSIAGIFYAAWLLSKELTIPDDKEDKL